MRRILIAAVLAVLPVHGVSQSGQASVEGRVVRHGTNEPVADARVTIGRPTVGPTTIPFQNWLGLLTIPQTETHTVTDSRGRFAFRSLEPGDYIVRTEAEGYRQLATFPGGPPQYSDFAKRFTLRSGEHLGNAALSLVPLASVRGIVRDPSRQAVPGIGVLLGKIEYSNGHRDWGQTESAQTNEDGGYQFRGLEPGDYYVVATREPYIAAEFEQPGRSGPLMATYFRRALSIASATPISLTAGSDARADIDLAVKPTNRRTISGTVIAGVLERKKFPGGIVLPTGSINLIPRGGALIWRSPVPHPSAAISESGEFQVKDVEPGLYDLYATSFQWPHMYLGHIAVDVTDRDITGLSVTFDRSSADLVRGRILDENGPILRPEVRLEARTVIPFFEPFLSNFSNGLNPPSADPLEFRFANVPPGDYDLRIFPSSETYVADIRQGGQSIFDSGLVISVVRPEPIDVILRHGGGAVNVRVLGDRGRSGLLVLVPDAPRRNIRSLYQDINVTTPTSYTFKGVRPGSYKVFAIESWLYDPYQGAYLNADYLAKYEDLGIPVTVRDGATVNVRLNLVRK